MRDLPHASLPHPLALFGLVAALLAPAAARAQAAAPMRAFARSG